MTPLIIRYLERALGSQPLASRACAGLCSPHPLLWAKDCPVPVPITAAQTHPAGSRSPFLNPWLLSLRDLWFYVSTWLGDSTQLLNQTLV